MNLVIAGPNYKSQNIRFGGHLSDIPKPHIRMFPNTVGRKRRVNFAVDSWVGMGQGAKHFYVKMRQEDNLIWDESDGIWTQAWDDEEADGSTKEWTELSIEMAISKMRIESEKFDIVLFNVRFGSGDETFDEYSSYLRGEYSVVQTSHLREGD